MKWIYRSKSDLIFIVLRKSYELVFVFETGMITDRLCEYLLIIILLRIKIASNLMLKYTFAGRIVIFICVSAPLWTQEKEIKIWLLEFFYLIKVALNYSFINFGMFSSLNSPSRIT